MGSLPSFGSSSTLTVNTNVDSAKPSPSVPQTAGLDPIPTVIKAANAALLERTAFAIDDAKDDEDDEDEDDDDFIGVDNDDQVMDEVGLFIMEDCLTRLLTTSSQVDAFLEAHDSGLTEADKAIADGLSFRRFSHLFDLTIPFADLRQAQPMK